MADRTFGDDVKNFLNAVAGLAGINRENIQGANGAVHRQVAEAERLANGPSPAASELVRVPGAKTISTRMCPPRTFRGQWMRAKLFASLMAAAIWT